MRILAILVVLLSACNAMEDTTNPTVMQASAVQACEDLQAAHRAMVMRCGLVEANDGLDFQYVDCSTVIDIRDMDELYSTCIPSLETLCQGEPGCYPWGTIGECRQFLYR